MSLIPHPQGHRFSPRSSGVFLLLLLFLQMIEFHFISLGNTGARIRVRFMGRTLAPGGLDAFVTEFKCIIVLVLTVLC